MAKAKEVTSETITNEEAAEIIRQIRKRDEWMVKLGDALEAAIKADAQLSAKQAAVGTLSAEHEKIADDHRKNLERLQAEAKAAEDKLRADYNRKAGEMAAEIQAQEVKKQKLYADIADFVTHIEELKKEKVKVEGSVGAAKAAVDAELKAYRDDMAKQKVALEDELTGLRAAIKVLRNSLANVPAMAE